MNKTIGDVAAAGVDRQPAARCRQVLDRDEVARGLRGAEPVVDDRGDCHPGEILVDLRHIDVLGPITRLSPHPLRQIDEADARVRLVVVLARSCRGRGPHHAGQQVGRFLLHLFGPLGRDNDDRSRAIVFARTIEQVIGFGDIPRPLIGRVVDLLAVTGRTRIILGVMITGQRDRLERGARHAFVLDHPLAAHRRTLQHHVDAVDQELGGCVALGDRHLEALVAALGHCPIDHHDLGLSGKDGLGGNADRCGNAPAVGPGHGAIAQRLGAQRGHQLLPGVTFRPVGHETVDFRRIDPRVLTRRNDRPQGQLDFRIGRGSALVIGGLPDADDCGRAAEWMMRAQLPSPAISQAIVAYPLARASGGRTTPRTAAPMRTSAPSPRSTPATRAPPACGSSTSTVT